MYSPRSPSVSVSDRLDERISHIKYVHHDAINSLNGLALQCFISTIMSIVKQLNDYVTCVCVC